MSEPMPAGGGEAAVGELQFDRAQFVDPTAATLTCAACQQPIAHTYYEVNGQTTCADCRTKAEQAVAATSGATGVIRALGAGIAAGVAGALLYYAVVALTGYQFGLIAIVVGLMVGGAVRWGSGGRGGPIFQAIAVVLTYFSIVGSYAPFVVQGLREAATSHSSGGGQTTTDALPSPTSSARPADGSGTAQAGAVSGGDVAFALLLFAGIVLIAPFLGGFSNLLGLLILAFGLYEAWKMNKRVVLQVTGPFAIGAGASAPGSMA
jgi:hypothetical protein